MAGLTSHSTGSQHAWRDNILAPLVPPGHSMYVKRELVKCLYSRARGITFQKNDLTKEEENILEALQQNGYLFDPSLTGSVSSPHAGTTYTT